MPNYLIKYGGNQKIVELEKIIDDYRLYYLNNLFEIKLIFYGPSRMLQFSQFVWPLSYSVWDVFNNFLLIDATDRSKISSDQKRFFIALSLYPFHFSRTLPLRVTIYFTIKGSLNLRSLYSMSFMSSLKSHPM